MSQRIRSQGIYLNDPIGTKNTYVVEDIEILVPVKFCLIPFSGLSVCECIGVLRHMQQYFRYICSGTDVQADWRSYTYGRAPKAIDIS